MKEAHFLVERDSYFVLLDELPMRWILKRHSSPLIVFLEDTITHYIGPGLQLWLDWGRVEYLSVPLGTQRAC